jgi:hypothetical protein
MRKPNHRKRRRDPATKKAAMANIPPDAMFTRAKGAEALSDLGYPVTKATLATLATRGGGPIYRRFGKRVLYRGTDLLAWAEKRCTATRRSTSEADCA